ncbi:unnamed protein product, partial [Prorocentrum cordatum]
AKLGSSSAHRALCLPTWIAIVDASRAERQKAGTSAGSTPKDKKLQVEEEEKEVEGEAMEGGDEDMSAKEMLKKIMAMMTATRKDMKDTKADDVVEFMSGILEGVSEKGYLEDAFAFGKKFKSADAMWEYMGSHAGNHVHQYKGSKVHCNADSHADPESEDSRREKAARKVVRAVIETSGGNGEDVKKRIDTNYRKGVAWFNEERIAQ